MARAGGQDYDSLTEYSVFVVITDDEGPPNLNPQAQKVDFKTVDLTKLVITLLGNATVYMDTMVDEADVLLGYNEYVRSAVIGRGPLSGHPGCCVVGGELGNS